MRAETKATSIPPEVKKAVYIRDNGFCVLCGSPYGDLRWPMWSAGAREERGSREIS